MKLETQWFCYLAVQGGVLRPDQCAKLLAEAGGEAEMLPVAQAALDSGLCTDVDRLQGLLGAAAVRTEAIGRPPSQPSAPSATTSNRGVTETSWEITFPELEWETPEAALETVKSILSAARAAGASDLHLCAGAIPFCRRFGGLIQLGSVPLRPAAAEALALAPLTNDERTAFRADLDLDAAVDIPGDGRYRVNLQLSHAGVNAVFHVVPVRVRALPDLGFRNHEVLQRLLDHPNGLILVTGPAGSGKTTTLSAMVDWLNDRRHDHIITIEDPVETVHTPRCCWITQREIGRHTRSYATALKAALREDPDIIVIGELHDLETMEMAVTAAETGHLVLGTLHTRDAASTLNRLVGAFPPKQQAQIRAMTAESLRGILCQQLLPRIGGGQALAYELMIANGTVRSLIREGKPHLLPGIMQTGTSDGMCTMDRCLVGLVREGTISRTAAASILRSNQAANELEKLPDETPPRESEHVLDTAEHERRRAQQAEAGRDDTVARPAPKRQRRYL